jgi:LysR family transcriptional regulator, glycine cleavage system transcriptional activator
MKVLMPRRLPNLNQLRAFEATARHLSFKNAARELFVTQAAISHQVKALEQDIGRQLFHRHGRKISLTEEARRFVADITPALDQIAQAAATLKSTGIAGTLKLSLAGFFADRVVRPNLAEFKALYPDLKLEFSYSREIVDFDTTDFDAAVIYGDGSRKGLVSIPICNVRTAVCSPSLLDGLEMPVSAEQIARLPLATTKGHTTGWIDWFSAAGIDDTSNFEFIEFDNGGLGLDFASTGEGVALVADIPLIKHELSTGSLVIINPLTVTLDYGIYLFFPETQHPAPRILAFADWLKSVVARIQAG